MFWGDLGHHGWLDYLIPNQRALPIPLIYYKKGLLGVALGENRFVKGSQIPFASQETYLLDSRTLNSNPIAQQKRKKEISLNYKLSSLYYSNKLYVIFGYTTPVFYGQKPSVAINITQLYIWTLTYLKRSLLTYTILTPRKWTQD